MIDQLVDEIEARRGHERFDMSWGYHSIVSVKHRYVCMAVPKVACTTLIRTLRELEGLAAIDDHGELHQAEDQERLSWFDDHESAMMLTSENWTRFAFVRNPYDRALSAWKSKITNDGDRQYAPFRDRIREANSYPASRAGRDPTVSFRDFVRYVAGSDDPTATLDGHWETQTSVLLYDLIRYDMLGRFEFFVEEFTKILKTLGAPERVLRLAAEVTNSTPRIPLAAAYDRDLADLVYEVYKSDFDAFGYDRDSWMFI